MTDTSHASGLAPTDWEETPVPVADPTHPAMPSSKSAHDAVTSPAATPATSGPVLHMPEQVALMFDAALYGDRALNGSIGPDGTRRSKNLAVLIGSIRVAKAGPDGKKVITPLGATEYRYELSIHEVMGTDQSAEYLGYRLPLSMTDAVRARAQHLLRDGQRVALLGPLGMEEYYDPRFRRDIYDVGRRTWDIRIDVLDVQEAPAHIPDVTWVQFEGEVVDRPRLYVRHIGNRRDLVELYAGVTLRYRDILPSSMGRVVRPVVKTLPVEVLIDAETEFIPQTDALFRPGNKVRIEGRLNPIAFRLPKKTLRDAGVREALTKLEERFAAQLAEAKDNPGKRAFLERIMQRDQERLLTVRRLHVEVGYIELLEGELASPDVRIRLIHEGGKRRTTSSGTSATASALPDPATVAMAQDRATLAMLMNGTPNGVHHDDEEEPTAPAVHGAARPRRKVKATPEQDG